MIKGTIDFKGFEAMAERVSKLGQQAVDNFMTQTVKEVAARMLAKVTDRTPVGDYGPRLVEFTTKDGKEVSFMANPNKVGGTLRRGWTVGDVTKQGNTYLIEVINPVFYVPFVEYGHRTVNGSGWVEGKFMMTLSEDELQQELPALLEEKFTAFLEGYINGDA